MSLQDYDFALASYAKMNLGLNVLAKRKDGYHAIETIFQELEFHDTLYFRKQGETISIRSNNPELPLGDTNLVYKAIQLLHRHCQCPTGVALYIEKNIPLGAGLGGGSSNAAQTLLGMNQLFQLGLSVDELATLGAQLGSDVPFFLYGGTALGTGRGEQIRPLPDFPQCQVLLVNPGIHVSSAWAYKNVNLKLTNSKGLISLSTLFKTEAVTEPSFQNLQNDLEAPVMEKYPIIRSIKAQLYENGAEWAMMSGSGSTVFGIFHKKEFAEKALRQIKHPDGLTVVTQSRSGNS